MEKAKVNQKTKIAVIDAETDPFDGTTSINPFIWGFYDGEKYLEFDGPYCTENLVDYIKEFKGTIFAHNGGKFDFHFLLDYIDKGTKLTVINGRIAKAKLGLATLHDSYCLLPEPLSAMQKDEIDYNLMRKENREIPENKKLISDYLRGDCVYLFEYLERFIKDYGYNITLASTAFKYWQKNFAKIPAPKSNADYYDKFYPYYYGGRVEVFESGIFTEKYKVFDIKSAYPRAMLEEHPIGTKYYQSNTPRDSHLAKSFLTVQCVSQGALPQRTKQGLHFPKGKGIFNITGHEFITGIETGTITEHKILKCFVFEQTGNFREYIEYFYDKKLKAELAGDKKERTFAKLFQNTLYGKFAMDPRRYEECYLGEYGERPKEDYAPGPIIRDSQLFFRDLPEEKHRFLNIATSASITGWVRAYLWKAINKCNGVLYCDTDSIICRDGEALEQGLELGQWECEGECSKVAIAGKKLYACWGDFGKGKTIKKACKGVNLSPEEIETIAKGGEIEYTSSAPSFSLKRAPFITKRNVRKTV